MGRKIQLNAFSICNTSGIVYLIHCLCSLLYVGKTERPLKLRILEHHSRIHLKVEKVPLLGHFLQAKNKEDDSTFTVLHVVRLGEGDPQQELLRNEMYWTFRINYLMPMGLNVNLDLSSYL